MTSNEPNPSSVAVTFPALLRVFTRVGLLSFGGPPGRSR